jgi:hypothetical protein
MEYLVKSLIEEEEEKHDNTRNQHWKNKTNHI